MEPITAFEVDQYLETVLWAESDNSDPNTGGDPLQDNFTVDDFTDAAREQARAELTAFWSEASRVLEMLERDGRGAPDASSWPHDFWLNRNGHGTGFWDKKEKYGDAAEALDVLAKRAGERNVEVVVVDEGSDGVQVERIVFFPELGSPWA
jgi:hypothetical protein